MTVLYHGSHYSQNELMPGYKRSGKLVEWDKTESNKWLYATTVQEEAIILGFASAVEKHFDLHHFRVINKGYLEFIFNERPPHVDEMCRLELYLYTIHKATSDGWVKVNNTVNGMDTEWKTDKTLQMNIISKDKVDLFSWRRGKEIRVKMIPPAYVGWAADKKG